MTYFITAKQIVEKEAESERPTSKKKTTTNGKRTKYLSFFGKRNTLNWKTKNPQLRWKGLLQSTKMGQLIWSVTIPFRHLGCSRLFCTVGHLESNVCLGEGRVQWSFTVLAPYIEKVCGIIVFGKFSCGAYVIVVLNSNIMVFLNMRNFFLIGSAIFSMVLSNSSIFLCGVTMFRIPLAAL